jgi:hypothetical protein
MIVSFFGKTIAKNAPNAQGAFDPLLLLAKTIAGLQKSMIDNSRKIQEKNREQEKAIRIYRENFETKKMLVKRENRLLEWIKNAKK